MSGSVETPQYELLPGAGLTPGGPSAPSRPAAGAQLPASLPMEQPSPVRWACYLLALALVIGFLNESYRNTFITRGELVQTEDGESFVPADPEDFGAATKYTTMLVWALAIAAVALSFALGSHRSLPAYYMFCYLGMFACSVYLLLGMTTNPATVFTSSIRLFGKMAPGSLLAMGIFFLGANPEAWERIWKIFMMLLLLSCVSWVVSAMQMTQASRHQAYRWIFEAGLLLEVLALLPIAVGDRWKGPLRHLRWVPLLLLASTVLLEQVRLVLVVLVALLGCYAFLRRRARVVEEERGDEGGLLFGILMVGAACLVVVSIGWPMYRQSVIGASADQLYQRRYEDTRTGQIEPFFEKATWDKLLFGAGYPDPEENEYTAEGATGIDSGYLNALYVSGAPMMIFFLAMAVAPVLRSLRLRLSRRDAAVVACVAAYCLRLTSSTTIEYSGQFMVACLMMGRCAHLAHSAKVVDVER